MAMFRKLARRGVAYDEKIDWSKNGVLGMKEKVKVKANRMFSSQDPPRILFLGETGSGKSSYISSVVTTLSGDVTYVSMIGEELGREENTSKRYLEYRVFMGEDKEPLNFILCDARGIGKRNQLGVADREIERLMDGKLRHGDQIESERGSDGTLIDNRDPRPPSCVVIVQKAQRLGDVDKDVQEKLVKAVDIARGRGLPCSVILTHIDVVKPTLTNKLHKALSDGTLQERVQRAAKEVGVNTNRVFLVKNYTTETRTHVRQDILILRAVHGFLTDVSSCHRSVTPGGGGGRGGGAADPKAGDTTKALESRQPLLDPLTQSRFQRVPHDHDMPHPATTRRSLDERQRSNDSTVSAAYSGPRSSVSMQVASRQQMTVTTSPSQFCRGRANSDRPAKTTYTMSRGFYEQRYFTEETTPKSRMSHEETIPMITMGPNFMDSHISKNRAWTNTYSGNDSDVEDFVAADEDEGIGFMETFSEADTDEGIGSSISTFHEESEELCAKLRKIVYALEKCRFPEDYNEEAHFQGAKPLYQPTVLQLRSSNKISDSKQISLPTKLYLELTKTYKGMGPFYEQVVDTMHALSESHTASVWMSYTLPADLGLPMDTLPPISTDIQVFFLSPEHPPFLLTFFDLRKLRNQHGSEDPKAQEKLVKLYTLQLGKLLTTALLDFCCCDFKLIPCCIGVEDLTLPRLQEELREQSRLARKFFGGPLELSTSTYLELKAAAVAVTGVSHVPLLMTRAAEQRPRDEEEQQPPLVLMDPDWRAVVSLLVETVGDHSQLTYPPGSGFKTRVAVVEAAKRLSFVDHVLLVSHLSWLTDVCRELKRRVYEDTGVTLKLDVLCPQLGDVPQIKVDNPERPTYVISLDCSALSDRGRDDYHVLSVSEAVAPGSGSGSASKMTSRLRLSQPDWV